MGRRRKYQPLIDNGWTITTTLQAPTGRHLEPGTELKVTGERGRFRFLRHVDTGTVEWIEVIDKDRKHRFFRPTRITTVHRINRMRRPR